MPKAKADYRPRSQPAKQEDVAKLSDARLADAVYSLRERRLVIDREVGALKKDETRLKEELRDRMLKNGSTRIAGLIGQMSVKPILVPEIFDKEKFLGYIAKTKSFDLLQDRVSPEAFRERWQAGKEIPGVKPMRVWTMHVNKVGSTQEDKNGD